MQKNPAIVIRFAIVSVAVYACAGGVSAFAAEKAKHAAKIIVLQGQVFKKPKGSAKESPAKKDDLLAEGTVLVTKDRSFVKLLFVDNTQMNLGPNSSMQIEKYQSNEAGMIQLIDGKIRAKVQKDLLSKDKSERGTENKLLIRTKTAAMGVRGTDFQVTYSRANETTSLVTFESEVAMVQLDAGFAGGRGTASGEIAANLSSALQGGDAVVVGEGQFSAANGRSEASEPVRISPEQLEQLQKNETFTAAPDGAGQTQSGPAYHSPVAPGLSPQNVSTNPLEAVANSLQAMGGGGGGSSRDALEAVRGTMQEIQQNAAETAENQGAVLEGGYVDLARGVYVAPDPSAGAIFDPTTGLFIPDPSVNVGAGGGLELGQGVTISETGEVTRAPEPGQYGGGATTEGGRAPAGAVDSGASGGGDDLNDQDEADEDQESDDVQQQNQSATDTDVTFQITVQ